MDRQGLCYRGKYTHKHTTLERGGLQGLRMERQLSRPSLLLLRGIINKQAQKKNENENHYQKSDNENHSQV